MPGRPEVGYGSLVQTVIEIRVCACQYFTIAEMWLCTLVWRVTALLVAFVWLLRDRTHVLGHEHTVDCGACPALPDASGLPVGRRLGGDH